MLAQLVDLGDSGSDAGGRAGPGSELLVHGGDEAGDRLGGRLEAAAKERNATEILNWNDRLETYLAAIKVVIKRESV